MHAIVWTGIENWELHKLFSGKSKIFIRTRGWYSIKSLNNTLDNPNTKTPKILLYFIEISKNSKNS
jgi:hypothetical protein